ncbi:MAG: hypothetical protein IKP86_13350, partial [Anaerolineaceae bacterium]|nr:hypothetical protein [Anaerolineaceae bacterium]
IYSRQNHGENAAGDLQDIRSQMTDTKIQLRSGNISVQMTPSHYESYLQIFKTPQAAITAYARFIQLSRNPRRSKAEQREFEKCEKIDYLADDFDKSHNYLLEKKKFNQQDADYIFQLYQKERTGDGKKSAGVKNYKSASAIYMSLLFDSVFGNIRSAWIRDAKKGGNGLEDARDAASEKDWLDTYLNNSLKRHRDEMTTILRGIKRTDDLADEDSVFDSLTEFLVKSWLDRMFSEQYFQPAEMELGTGAAKALDGYKMLMEDNTAVSQNGPKPHPESLR